MSNTNNTDVEITLEYPVNFESQDITQITLRRPKYRDIKHSRTLKDDEVFDYFLTTLSEHPIELFEDLDNDDIKQLEKAVYSFLGIATT